MDIKLMMMMMMMMMMLMRYMKDRRCIKAWSDLRFAWIPWNANVNKKKIIIAYILVFMGVAV